MNKKSHTFLPLSEDGKIEIYNNDGKALFSSDIIENCSIVTLKEGFDLNFEDSEIVICKNNKTNLFGVLNNLGDIILDFEYASIKAVEDRKLVYDFIVIKDNKTGYATVYGTVIMEPKEEIVEFFDTYIVIKNNDKYGIMSYDNDVIIPCKYDNIIEGNYEVVIAYNKDEIGFIDLDKPNKFIKFDYVLQKLKSEDNSSLYFSKYNNEYILYYINKNEKGKIVSIEIIKPDINLDKVRFYNENSIDPEILSMIKTIITKVSKKEEKPNE